MARVNIIKLLDGKWEDGTRPKDIFALYLSENLAEYVEDVIAGLKSKNKKVKNGCAEIASLLSEHRPDLLSATLACSRRTSIRRSPSSGGRWSAPWGTS